ncbi:hypothetical protein KC675_00860, partial [Candidatus Dojkabacteria bacterium]|nr:hypothetical protein [Candidatus Dojkabacteria bacterium]
MNEDIQSEKVNTQPLEKQINEQVVGESDKAVDKTLKKKKVNFKRLFIASSVIILVWAVMVIVYLLYYKQDDGLAVPNDDDNAPLPTATVLPTIAFEFYSDDYLEFENPADTTVDLVGGINYHPELEGKTINGVQYLSITKSEDIKLEFIYLLQGGMFPYVMIDTKTLTLTQDTFNEVTYEYGLKETKLAEAPKIEKVPDYPLYLVQVDEMDSLYLMSMDEDGNYLSVNYGAWVDLDFMGKFTEDTEWGNFVGLKCVTETPDDSEYCKQMVFRFFESVEKKFEENEKYEKPKLEAILELRNQTTAELLNKYRFYIEDY